MAPDLRLAGRGRLPTGETVTWSIADGRRGRRWRELLNEDGRPVRTLLLELAPDGGVGRLEIASEAGLLTVHPSGDPAMLHGNVVSPEGVRHLTLGWSTAHGLVVDRSPAVAAALVGRIGQMTAPGGRLRLDVVRVSVDLRPLPAVVAIDRIDASTWELAIGSEPAERIVLDKRGLPILLDPAEWPLEI